MKAHIQAAPRCVLLWNFPPQSEGYTTLAAAAAAYRLTLRAVTAQDLESKIGDLCAGVPSPAAAPTATATAQPAMIISGLQHENGDLNGFVSAVKKGGAVLPLRATVTPTSKSWTLAALLAELSKEREALEGDKA